MLSRHQGHSAAGRIVSKKNSSDTMGNRTGDLLACGAVCFQYWYKKYTVNQICGRSLQPYLTFTSAAWRQVTAGSLCRGVRTGRWAQQQLAVIGLWRFFVVTMRCYFVKRCVHYFVSLITIPRSYVHIYTVMYLQHTWPRFKDGNPFSGLLR